MSILADLEGSGQSGNFKTPFEESSRKNFSLPSTAPHCKNGQTKKQKKNNKHSETSRVTRILKESPSSPSAKKRQQGVQKAKSKNSVSKKKNEQKCKNNGNGSTSRPGAESCRPLQRLS